MKIRFLRPLTVGAFLIVGVSCGKESSNSAMPCVSGCATGLPKPLPESEGTTSDIMRKLAAGRGSIPFAETKPNEERAERQDVYSDTTYVPALADACKIAGGTFVTDALDCECPDSSKGAVYSARSQACVTPVRDTSCTIPGETFMGALERRGTEDFITSCLSKVQTFEGTVTSIEIPSDRPARAREVAGILDRQPASRPLRGSAPRLSKREGWRSSFVVIYGASAFDERALYLKPYRGDPNDWPHFANERAVHISSAEGLASMFQHETLRGDNVSALPSLELFSKEHKEILRPLVGVLSERSASSNLSSFTPDLDGCSQLCTVRTNLSSLPGGQNVWRDRVFVWGQVFSDTISLGKNDNSVEARLVLGVGGALSVIEVQGSKLEGSTLTQVHSTLDAQGKLLRAEKKKDVDLKRFAELQPERDLASLGGDMPVIVCDDFFFIGTENKAFENNVLFGPYASSEPSKKGSLFGWEENTEASLGNFLGGLNQDVDFLKKDAFSDVFSAPFAGLTSIRARIIPVASARCKPGSSFLKTVQEKTSGKARVVAVLNASFENAQECRSRYGNDLEASTQLWVVTSGKSGTPGKDNFRCPQALGPSGNLLVAGGDLPRGGRSVSPADYGEDYQDITVISLDQRHATAVVARAAAAIQAAHGDVLSNPLIRLSLLLSVDLRKFSSGEWAPYPSRSGGYFNSERALKAAHFIATQLSPEQRAKFGASEAKAVIEHLFADADEVKYRVKLASERKGFLL